MDWDLRRSEVDQCQSDARVGVTNSDPTSKNRHYFLNLDSFSVIRDLECAVVVVSALEVSFSKLEFGLLLRARCLEYARDELLRFFLNPAQMLFPGEALGINLVNVFCA